MIQGLPYGLAPVILGDEHLSSNAETIKQHACSNT
ncbi:hypothetical protein CLV42_104398 [Chitinophaga ginsengisoli]|uniref:Uncharacterized protein n=1 Tax=Chitinophaga ginsengisoli TaxID=363837 RepID=A0A2P8GDX4_9BACT|nr:hypothetical protein CLV42_104398 [Chitinophaga ginsengisoli]